MIRSQRTFFAVLVCTVVSALGLGLTCHSWSCRPAVFPSPGIEPQLTP